jgi:tripartite-type tricarboxylate transporter receptor subunit TctC
MRRRPMIAPVTNGRLDGTAGDMLRFPTRMLATAALASLAAMPLATVQAQAQPAPWPVRAVRVIVPAPAGGPYDRAMRPLAQHMAQALKQPVVVDNRPSAGNIVGTQLGAAALPDGYTLTMTGMLNTIAAGLYEKLPFDIVEDFTHIGAIGEGAQWLVVRSGAGIDSFAALLQQARQAPGRIHYASSGAGSSGHLLMEQLQRATGAQLTHVPYKGGAPALQDVLAGVVDLTAIPSSAALAGLQSGKLKLLAVSSGQRSTAMPDAPTFAELGYPQLSITAWVGLSAPKGTPAAVVRTLHEALRTALAEPALLQQLQAEGMTVLADTPEQYAQRVRSDTERWGQLVRALNLKAN